MQNWINIARFQRFKWKHTMCQLAKHLIFPAAATGLSCLMELTSSKIHSLIPPNLPKYPAQNCPNSSSSHSEKTDTHTPQKKTGHGKHKHTPTAAFSFSSMSAATIHRTYCKAIHIAHLAWRGSEKSVLNRLDGVQDVVGRPKSKGKTSNEIRRHSRSPIHSDFRNKKTEGINISE